MKESKEFLRQQAIADELRKQKEMRSIRHTTSTTFKKGQPGMPGAGRKKGSKNSLKRKIEKEMKQRVREAGAALIVSLQNHDLDSLSYLQKVKGAELMFKYIFPELSEVKSTTTQIKKIEVSFSEAFGIDNESDKVIDITHDEVKKIEDKTEEDMNEFNTEN